jgi:hypothetical protein
VGLIGILGRLIQIRPGLVPVRRALVKTAQRFRVRLEVR